eukprot:3074735-Pyramimonas_sp.AAC.1
MLHIFVGSTCEAFDHLDVPLLGSCRGRRSLTLGTTQLLPSREPDDENAHKAVEQARRRVGDVVREDRDARLPLPVRKERLAGCGVIVGRSDTT